MAGFYGESWMMDWANAITGVVANWGDAMRKHFDLTSSTFGAGDSWIAAVYPDPYNLTSTDAAECSWVFELGDSTDGTIRVSAGWDPTWNLDNPALATEDLGTHALSGASTLVLPVDYAASQLLAYNDEPIVFVEVLSGAINIQQLKLRILPPGGPQGDWVSTESQVTTATSVRRYNVLGASVMLSGSYTVDWRERRYPGTDWSAALAEAWLGARADLQAKAGNLYSYETTSSSSAQLASSSLDASAGVKGFESGTQAVFVGADANFYENYGVLEADYKTRTPAIPSGGGPHPYEAWQEAAAWAKTSDGGKVLPTFAGWTGEFEVTYQAGWTSYPSPNGTHLWATGPAVLHQINLGSYDPEEEYSGTVKAKDFYEFVAGGAQTAIPANSATSGGATDSSLLRTVMRVPIFGGEAILVTARTPNFTDGVGTMRDGPLDRVEVNTGTPYEEVVIGTQVHVTVPDRSYRISFPDFLYFDPTLPWAGDPGGTPVPIPGKFLYPKGNLDGLSVSVDVDFLNP